MIDNAAIKLLMQEHEIILKAMRALERIGDGIKQGNNPDVGVLREALEFMHEFADRCHHSKEEDLLFPALERKGIPEQGGPIGMMKSEHEQARADVEAFDEAVQAYAVDGAGGADAVRAAIGNLAALYPDHIWKEDNVLYPMAVKVLSAAELDELLHQFEDVEAEFGPALYARLAGFADRLESDAIRAKR